MNQTDVLDTRFSDFAPEVCVSALSAKFASRGLAKSADLEAAQMMEAEEKTREIDPCAYRLSLLSDAAVKGIYRRGKDTMEAEDLLRYAEESLRLRQRENPAEEMPSIYEAAETVEKSEEVGAVTVAAALQRNLTEVKALPAKAIGFLREKLPVWFHFRAADTSSETKKIPISAFAAILAISVSLMLIVASALMITHTETKISKLNAEISTLQVEIRDLEGKLEANADLMEIRRIAIEEYGMVEEDYLKMERLSLDSAEEIRVYEQERNRELGISSILSAIGWKK